MSIEKLIGSRVRSAREHMGLTQDALGQRLSPAWSRQAVSLAESGQRAFVAADLVDLADALNVSPGSLIATGQERRSIPPTSCESLARIADALDALNSRQDRFYTEVLGVLAEAKEDEGRSAPMPPSAAPGCRVCGNVNIDDGQVCLFDDLTRTEWLTHRQHFFEEALSYRSEPGANTYADLRMHLDFGPCPEES